METIQKVATSGNPDDDVVVKYSYKSLTPLQQAFVDWKALNGLITDDQGMRKITLEELAQSYGINRNTFYLQTKHIPNLQELINQRHGELASHSRLNRVRETWYLKAVKGDWQHLNAYLYNFDPKYKNPASKIDVDVKFGWNDVLAAASKENVIEGEIANGPDADTTGSPEDQRSLPNPS